jgi:hypothetical protein
LKLATIGYDPAKNLAERASDGVCKHYCQLFDADHYLSLYNKAKIVTACAVIYHMPKPLEFLKQVEQILHPEGVFVTEFSYLPSIMKNHAFDAIGHEHLTHLSMTSFSLMLAQTGLEIVDGQLTDINSGTVILVIKHKSKDAAGVTQFASTLWSREQEMGLQHFDTYLKWAEECVEIRDLIVETLGSIKSSGKMIAIYGASTKGSILCQWAKIHCPLISYAIERNPQKVGREMIGLYIPIISEEEARCIHPDCLFVLPWAFRPNFIKRELAYLEKGGCMFFPLPKPELFKMRSDPNQKGSFITEQVFPQGNN